MPAARTTTAAPRPRRSAPSHRAGAAARARRPSSRPTPLRIRWERVGRIVLLVVLAVVLGLYVQQGLAYLSVRSQADQQAAIVEQLARQNRQLAREAKALNQPATIVREARELGMIKPGERPYVVTGLSGG
jgi:cell division protein FtsB